MHSPNAISESISSKSLERLYSLRACFPLDDNEITSSISFVPVWTFLYISKKYDFLTVCILTVQLDQFNYINKDYLKVKAANSILKSRAEKMLRAKVFMNDKGISTGSCRMCKPCRCKRNEPCRHPDKAMYSFEALGIHVSSMIEDLFDFKLQWYSKKQLPEYTSVVVGLLSKDKVDVNEIYSLFREME